MNVSAWHGQIVNRTRDEFNETGKCLHCTPTTAINIRVALPFACIAIVDLAVTFRRNNMYRYAGGLVIAQVSAVV